MSTDDTLLDDQTFQHRLRLSTLTRLRWLAVAGQSIAVVVIAYGFGFPMPELFCFVLIGCSAWLNIFLTVRYPPNHRLPPLGGLAVLSFDVLQLTSLLFLTGGLANPFSVLICVPVIICAASQPVRHTVALGALTFVAITFLAFLSLPLPWYPGTVLTFPFVLIIGTWIAILSTTAFAAFYVHRVSAETNELAEALTAAELGLQREQHLSALDGLAAAAAHELGTPLATISVVAREMHKALAGDPQHGEDVQLLVSQSERCRDILGRLTSLSTDDELHMRQVPLDALIEEVVAPHREFGVEIIVKRVTDKAPPGDSRHVPPEPIGQRNAGILYGLGNIVENAVDFARSQVQVTSRHDNESVEIVITDDGPGFSAEMLSRIGLPYMRSRDKAGRPGAGGLGLGLFIAKTLLERSGATLQFDNRGEPAQGARVRIRWPRSKMDVGAVTGSYTPHVSMGR
ncbi:ActS/PrrB/RegB family redox-sensitive histidine kinase [Pseudohoeflea coraliihabitans]|uniref:histidine kinase n=1 Tax=Pseudohoeflea coraliihabitans TaxID=2860393 RepID=A0ABS6WT02_9HYPH|nr:ActS/PrrB/RegB family redox-sensitive histidine kinase [Pseudohoeflea sp. DP4N28-3]MBW3099084.1 ActS/PrrB/RegB family redox-sensitive histidine kinase [Pseudohoeflea sp. DP4N28-3]